MMTKIEMQAMDVVIGTHREMKRANESDWEQRRYEVVKETFLYEVRTFLNSVKDDAESAVEWADLPVSELKKEK